MKHKIVKESISGELYYCVYEKKSWFGGWKYKNLFSKLDEARDHIKMLAKPVVEVYKDGVKCG